MNAMNGFPAFDRDLDNMHMGNGHVNSFGSGNFSPSGANPYPDFAGPGLNTQFANNLDMRQQMSSPSNALGQGGQWPEMFGQNHQQQRQMHPAQMAGHSQQFNQQWNMGNFPNQMRGMPMGPNGQMPYIPLQQQQHMMNAMVIHKEDEALLIKTLIHAQTKRISYKDALNSLHLTNNHSAALWKDHYLEYKYRLDGEIASYFSRLAVKKPSLTEQLASPIASSSSLKNILPQKQARARSRKSTPTTGVPRRSTINSLTTHTAVFDKHLPPPHVDLKVPEPPSRSPTPPTLVVSMGRGNKFTEQDKTFFIKFISRRLQGDASLTRVDLCQMLAEKAPHHSNQSWASYWQNNHDLPDKILAAAKGELEDDEESEEEKVPRRTRTRPKSYKDLTTDEEGDEDDDDKDDPDAEDDEDAIGDDDDDDDDDDEDSDTLIPPFDEKAMGTKGGPFTKADFAITARHIASFPEHATPNFHEKWIPFAGKYPQRSAKSWAEYYRRNQKALEKLAQRIREQSPPSKRKFDSDDDDESKDGKHPKLASS